jgi:high-affinity nickel-transport protein
MTLPGALITCTFLGMQHGIDVDHVAAITDVTSIQRTPLDATRCGLLYAVGHAATVGVLGIAVITLRHSVPPQASQWMERIIGMTLVLLGVYVFSSLLTTGVAMGRSRALMAMFNHLRRQPSKPDTDGSYGPKSSLSLGVLHGIGAETPTQLSVLLIAANLGGIQNGILGLSVFAVGMFVSNMVLTTAATGIFSIAKAKPGVLRFLAALTAAYSLWIGIRMIFG